MELYVEFAKVDGFGQSSTIVAANVGTKAEVESHTTRRTNDLLLSTGASEDTLNPLLKCDNDGANEEEDAVKEKDAIEEEYVGEEEGVVAVVDEVDLNRDPIR
ncbi:hypothetical protein J1N35_000947 [Gossypium stocksii]|uniref:Uncharacterized protein n=1 Tax=Gossypium stocksii TaxID=47602 RepID=A0A9D3WJ13_9ROSI|nr:hypothetical protein J1N35_000947 [Gossypium stocksii]